VRISGASPLVLGSASPRRRELLQLAGIPLVVHAASIDERGHPGEASRSYLERIVRAKLDALRSVRRFASRACLVADTIVVAPDGEVLGKPDDAEDAYAMIERLSDGTHEVSTRFLLAPSDVDSSPAHSETVTTRVTFRRLAPGEARRYATSGEGRDKAGAYAIQGGAAAFAQRIEGSYSNVVGLPLCEVVTAMRALGWIEDS
jgi:septum formation protein